MPASLDLFPPGTDAIGVCKGDGTACLDIFHTGNQAANGDKEIFVVVYHPLGGSIIPGTWTFQLEGDVVASGRFDGWSLFDPWVSFVDPEMSVGMPGTAFNAMTIGAYTTREFFVGQTLNDRATFSSRGPTRDGRTKPEVAAPGSSIISSASAVGSIWSDDPGLLLPGELHGQIQGTSMATPHAAGAGALLLQADPTLDADGIHHLLTGGAVADGFTGAVPNFEWGYGKLEVFASICTAPGAPAPAACSPSSLAVASPLVVILDDGGAAGPGDFTVFIDGVPATPGVPVGVEPGPHALTWEGPFGYTASFGAPCATDGTITIDPEQDAVCSATFDDLSLAADSDGDSNLPPDYLDCQGPCPGGYFRDAVEAFMGIDHFDRCPPAGDVSFADADVWPPDFNGSGSVNLLDVFAIRPVFGTASGDGTYLARFDFNASGNINLLDVFIMRPYFGLACTPPP